MQTKDDKMGNNEEKRRKILAPAHAWKTKKLFNYVRLVGIYRKIPKISPGAYIFRRLFLRGLYSEGLIYEGKLRFKINWASLIVGSKCIVFTLFYFERNFPITSPLELIFGGVI